MFGSLGVPELILIFVVVYETRPGSRYLTLVFIDYFRIKSFILIILHMLKYVIELNCNIDILTIEFSHY